VWFEFIRARGLKQAKLDKEKVFGIQRLYALGSLLKQPLAHWLWTGVCGNSGGWEQMSLKWPITSLGVVTGGIELCYLSTPSPWYPTSLSESSCSVFMTSRKTGRQSIPVSYLILVLTFYLTGIQESSIVKLTCFIRRSLAENCSQISCSRAGGPCKWKRIWPSEVKWIDPCSWRSHMVFPRYLPCSKEPVNNLYLSLRCRFVFEMLLVVVYLWYV